MHLFVFSSLNFFFLSQIEQQLIDCRRELQSERSTVANLRRTQAHAELIAQKEKSLGEKLLEENERLMSENAKLTSEVQAYKDSEGRWDKVRVFPSAYEFKFHYSRWKISLHQHN